MTIPRSELNNIYIIRMFPHVPVFIVHCSNFAVNTRAARYEQSACKRKISRRSFTVRSSRFHRSRSRRLPAIEGRSRTLALRRTSTVTATSHRLRKRSKKKENENRNNVSRKGTRESPRRKKLARAQYDVTHPLHIRFRCARFEGVISEWRTRAIIDILIKKFEYKNSRANRGHSCSIGHASIQAVVKSQRSVVSQTPS